MTLSRRSRPLRTRRYTTVRGVAFARAAAGRATQTAVSRCCVGTVVFYLFFWALLVSDARRDRRASGGLWSPCPRAPASQVVIFLNVIFGVIVDTFGDLRDMNKVRGRGCAQ